MKKFTFFFLIGLLALTISASAQRATLRVSRNYEVAIDGRTYSGNNIIYMAPGYHQVNVYGRSGFIFRRRSIISSQAFDMRGNDVMIDVDQSGQLRIYQNGYGGYDNGYGNYDGRGNRGNGNGWGPYNNPGRGHKYGLYKNKNRRDRDYDDDDRYERRDRDDD